MTDLRKAADMALDAMEWHVSRTRPIENTTEAIQALRQALAQPETPDDLLRQSEKEGWRYAKECEAEVMRLKALLAQPEQELENEAIKTISNAIDYLYSTKGEAKNVANQAHLALKRLQINLRDQTVLHLLYKGDYEDLLAQPEQEHESRITSLEIRVAKLENPMTEHEKQLMAGQRSLLRTAPTSKQEPDYGIDRGAWSDVPDATKWVDELRGDEDSEQEPVAHLWECLGRWSAYLATNGTQADCAPPDYLVEAVKAATAPPSKPWVSLTSEELVSIVVEHASYPTKQLAAIEAALRSKNNG